MSAPYEVVVGLEVHVQLQTTSKLFCGCAVQFAAPPNSCTCPVCCGMPGVLPVLNARAVELAVRAGLGLHCEIARRSRWDRKHYFYPDLPKGYQISQLDQPLCFQGWLDVPAESDQGASRRVRIARAHLEEDAGKSLHGGTVAGQDVSFIDLNRAGAPLLEIVTEPDLRGADETRKFLIELRQLLMGLAVTDGNMQEGSLRVDANINLHVDPGGRNIATPIVEIKNLNSFRGVQRAVDYEAQRLYAQWQSDRIEHRPGNKQTRGWDDERGESYLLREKEEAEDYRYFPDPDLPELELDPNWVETIRISLSQSPAELRCELIEQHGLSQYDADVLVAQGAPVIEYFRQAVAAGAKPKPVANWLMGDVANLLNERQGSIAEFPVTAADLGRLLALVDQGHLTQALARDWLRIMVSDRQTLGSLLANHSREPVDAERLRQVCRELMHANPQAVAAFRAGKAAALGPLIGQIRRAIPNVDPRAAQNTLQQLIRELP